MMLAISVFSLFLMGNIVTAENLNSSDYDIKILFPYPIVNLDIKTNKNSYFIGEDVEITIENNDDKPAYFYKQSYHWTIEHYKNGQWYKIYPCFIEIGNSIVTKIDPGDVENDIWEQKTCQLHTYPNKNQAQSGYYRVVVKYWTCESYDASRPSFIKYSYFAINNLHIEYIENLSHQSYLEYLDAKDQFKDLINAELPEVSPIPESVEISTINESDAVSITKEKAKLKSVKTVQKQKIDNKQCYKIKGIKETKLFWLIPADMEVTVYIYPNDGHIDKIEKPWWSFIAS